MKRARGFCCVYARRQRRKSFTLAPVAQPTIAAGFRIGYPACSCRTLKLDDRVEELNMRKQFRCVLAATAALTLAGAPAFAQQERDLPQGGSVSRPPAGDQADPGRRPAPAPAPTPSGQADRAPSPKASPDEK